MTYGPPGSFVVPPIVRRVRDREPDLSYLPVGLRDRVSTALAAAPVNRRTGKPVELRLRRVILGPRGMPWEAGVAFMRRTAAGVAHKTFCRVLTDHPGIKRQLDMAEAILDRRSPGDERAPEHDPLERDPAAAIEELLETITQLTCVIESQRVHIADLERQLGIQPVAFEPDTDQRRRGHRHVRRRRNPV